MYHSLESLPPLHYIYSSAYVALPFAQMSAAILRCIHLPHSICVFNDFLHEVGVSLSLTSFHSCLAGSRQYLEDMNPNVKSPTGGTERSEKPGQSAIPAQFRQWAATIKKEPLKLSSPEKPFASPPGSLMSPPHTAPALAHSPQPVFPPVASVSSPPAASAASNDSARHADMRDRDTISQPGQVSTVLL